MSLVDHFRGLVFHSKDYNVLFRKGMAGSVCDTHYSFIYWYWTKRSGNMAYEQVARSLRNPGLRSYDLLSAHPMDSSGSKSPCWFCIQIRLKPTWANTIRHSQLKRMRNLMKVSIGKTAAVFFILKPIIAVVKCIAPSGQVIIVSH